MENLTKMFLAHEFYSISWLYSVFVRKVAKQETQLLNFQSYDFATTHDDIKFCIIAKKSKLYSLIKKERGYIFMNYTKPSPHPNQASPCFRQQVIETANFHLTCQNSWSPLKAIWNPESAFKRHVFFVFFFR